MPRAPTSLQRLAAFPPENAAAVAALSSLPLAPKCPLLPQVDTTVSAHLAPSSSTKHNPSPRPSADAYIQTDNDSSFAPQFTWHLSDLSISHRHIPPGCPEVNGKVERSHKTDSEEFYRGKRFRHKKDLARKLKRWETEYKQDRPHLAMNGQQPAERVGELVPPAKEHS